MRTIRTATLLAALTAGATVASEAWAHSLKQKVGGYADNDGLARQRVGLDAVVDGGMGEALTGSSYTLSATRDAYTDERGGANEYEKQVYGSGHRLNRALTVGAVQTWDRVVETHALVSGATDDFVKSRTWSAGFSSWLRHETVKVGVDLSRTVVDQPVYRILDFDSREIGNPALMSSTGTTLTVRHLATSRTVMDYSLGYIEAANRPATRTATVAGRQFFPGLGGAANLTVARGINRGNLATDTTYGQVDAWQAETGWAQNLWAGALAKLGYRYYKEGETTRAYSDEKVFGSDTMSFGLSQEFKPHGARQVPITVECAAARYLTNIGVAARSFEAGLTARF